MKRYGKNWAPVILLFIGQIVSNLFAANAGTAPEKYFDPARGAGLRYNHPIVITSQGRTLWTHTMSRLRGNTDETRYNPEKPHLSIPATTPAPNDHFEVLATEFNADGRIKDGACLFFLQKVGDLKNTGLVRSGDTVLIIAIYAAAGYKEKAGILPSGRILHVENSSRIGEHDLSKELSHYDTFVSLAAFPGTQDDGGKFIVQGSQPGALYAKDVITIQNKEYKRPLCVLPEGRWGAKFGELTAVKGAEKDAPAQFTMSLVDVDTLSDAGRENLKDALSATLKSNLFSLSAEHSPGNSPFRFNPALHGGRSRALFNDPAWRLAEASEGYIIFDVTPNGGSVKVVFSPGPRNSPEAYVIVIGDEKNSSTRISKGDKVIATAQGAKVSNAIFSDLGKSSSFWVKISGKILTVGSGRELGKNEFLRFEETDSEAALVSFVGLAGSESALFENIVINSKAAQAKLASDTKTATASTSGTAAATIATKPAASATTGSVTATSTTASTTSSSAAGTKTSSSAGTKTADSKTSATDKKADSAKAGSPDKSSAHKDSKGKGKGAHKAGSSRDAKKKGGQATKKHVTKDAPSKKDADKKDSAGKKKSQDKKDTHNNKSSESSGKSAAKDATKSSPSDTDQHSSSKDKDDKRDDREDADKTSSGDHKKHVSKKSSSQATATRRSAVANFTSAILKKTREARERAASDE